MSLYVSIIGIDGSGKSTLTAALADVVPAELRVITAAVGDDLRCKAPEEDMFLPSFMPDGAPMIARLGQLFRHAAHAVTSCRHLYPPLKLAQLAAQERMVRLIASGYRPDIIFGDGNLVLSAAGRAVNYMDAPVELAPGTFSPLEHIEALFDHVMDGPPLPAVSARLFPGLKLMRCLARLDRQMRLGLLEMPDALILLDIDPQAALARLKASGKALDRHENIHDLAHAQAMYRGVVELFRRRCGHERAAVIDVTALSIGQVIRRVVEFVGTLPLYQRSSAAQSERLGATSQELSQARMVLRKMLTYRYLVRHALPNLHHGSAHELTFLMAPLGRQLFHEGYSAGLMRAIYLQEQQRYGLLDRVFLDYPLHRAIYHRLLILRRAVERELWQRMGQVHAGATIRILTAPSGYAFDLLQPLKRITGPARTAISILASDLDPDGQIERTLNQTAVAAIVDMAFLRGNLTHPQIQEQLTQSGPYDMVLFIGLSTWIAKPDLVQYVRLARERLLAPAGVFFTDCFSPGAFALAGKYAGYQASYYAPREFTSILAYCGFEPRQMLWESGPEGINHVCVARI